MKKSLKALGGILFALCYLFAVASCGAAGSTGGGYKGGMVTAPSDSAGSSDSSASDSTQQEQEVERPAGLLTAGAWNDNENYAYWQSLFMQEEAEEGKEAKVGKFFDYSKTEKSWGFNSLRRVKVTVKDGEKVVAGAKVCTKNKQDKVEFEAVTDANGVAYLFTGLEEGTVEANGGHIGVPVAFTAQDEELTIDLAGSSQIVKQDVIELMFVVDVTGSMGDELTYLNNEIADVVNRVAAMHSETQINLALLFYRDYTDKDIFKYYDFENVTTEEGMAKQQKAIAEQKATGGGDYPEAVEDALKMAVEKQWSSGATTKLLFHVLDAPPHEKASNQHNFRMAVLEATRKGVRICPVLCSGSDILTEYVMRQAAIYTGGTFVFVTDDSGIGNPHYDPNLPNVTVEALNSLMVRLINGYHSGVFAEPVYWRDEVLTNTPMPI